MFVRVALAFWLACPSVSFAALMTFDGLPRENAKLTTWVEDGITATASGGWLAMHATGGAAHLDGAGATTFARQIDFVTGSPFVVENLTLRPSGSDFCEEAKCLGRGGVDPYPYIEIKAFLGGTLTAALNLFRPATGLPEVLSLSLFGPVDRLTVGVSNQGLIDGRCGWDHGCGHFNIESVMLTPVSVPEPETFLLMLPGLAALLLRRRRRLTRSVPA